MGVRRSPVDKILRRSGVPSEHQEVQAGTRCLVQRRTVGGENLGADSRPNPFDGFM